MTRARAADDFGTIFRRQREIAAETGEAIAGKAECQCPMSPNAQGVEIKVHVPGCPTVAAQYVGYGAMLRDRVMCELLAEEEWLRVLESAGLR